MPAGLEADEFSPGRGDAVRARHIREGHHAVGVADIERVAQQRHAERLVQSLHENLARFGDAVAIGVAQQRDAVGADAKRGGTPHRRLHRIAEHAPGRSGDLVRLGNEDVAIGQHVDPARMLQAGRERIDLESRRRHRHLPVAPPPGRRHLERRDAPCGFAAGTTGALPQAGSGAEPCDRRHSSAAAPISATMRAKIAEKLMSFPVDRAHTIRQHGALKPCPRGRQHRQYAARKS